ncbi:hypothetical protein ACF3NG_07495 [Aerococcaceae bacterium WGS1372]
MSSNCLTIHHRLDHSSSSLMKSSLNVLKRDLGKCNQWVDYQDTFAYPFGFLDDSTLNNLVQVGINFIFTTQSNLNTESTNPMALNRLLVHNQLSLDDFKYYLKSK